jgi:beta-galactosidase GanA
MYNALDIFPILFARWRHEMRCTWGTRVVAAAALLLTASWSALARADAQDLPKLVEDHGRATLMVDGAPYFLLGAQVDNSSGWPDRLKAVWPAAEALRLNTLEVPVYWEQLEPTRGTFDFTVVDSLLAQAREHHVRLVLLWFGTWKNGKMHYVPDWVKSDPVTYPRMLSKSGVPIDVLSPNSPANLDADSTAFAALMDHLKETDPQHTVLMMQVENESGSLGLVRDFSPLAQKIFDAPVPPDLLKALKKQPGTWSQVFGDDADETFAAWSVSRYINAVAAAGKRELALPMYVNNWLKSPRAFPVTTVPGDDYPSGGPTINMFPVWKAMAPSIDLLAPDIYVPNSERYRSVMREFHQPNNPLLIPESLGFEPFSGATGYARYLYFALGDGAVGFANFGLDRLDIAQPNQEMRAVVNGFALLGGFTQELAALKFAGKLQSAVEENGISEKELTFAPDGTSLQFDGAKSAPAAPANAAWRVIVSFPPSYDPPAAPVSTTSDTTGLHEGRAVVASLGPNEFLVAGIDCRVQFALPVHSAGKQPQMLKVEEGRYEGAQWIPTRLWNGDETDYGLNFGGRGSLLRVTMGSY